jgi:hypothetical protein
MFLKCKNKQILIHGGFIVVLVRLKIKKVRLVVEVG